MLVNGAAGGVGVAAVQLGVLAGASVVASVRAAHAAARSRTSGRPPSTRPRSATTAPTTWSWSWSARRTSRSTSSRSPSAGRIVDHRHRGRSAGPDRPAPAHVAVGQRSSASTLRARPLEEKAVAARLVEHQVLPSWPKGRIRVPDRGGVPARGRPGRLRALRGRVEARQDRPRDHGLRSQPPALTYISRLEYFTSGSVPRRCASASSSEDSVSDSPMPAEQSRARQDRRSPSAETASRPRAARRPLLRAPAPAAAAFQRSAARRAARGAARGHRPPAQRAHIPSPPIGDDAGAGQGSWASERVPPPRSSTASCAKGSSSAVTTPPTAGWSA